MYLSLPPQSQAVLKQMQASSDHSITASEASTVNKVRSLSRRICDLKSAGYKVRSEMHRDCTGQRFKRYFLES
jgi:hypothetical protein